MYVLGAQYLYMKMYYLCNILFMKWLKYPFSFVLKWIKQVKMWTDQI